jgi:hypothetical protein
MMTISLEVLGILMLTAFILGVFATLSVFSGRAYR